jgi:acyl-coenzyme A synthetase/AMP-(fatty) acid ligase
LGGRNARKEQLKHLSASFIVKYNDGGYFDPKGYIFIMRWIDYVINVSGHRLSIGEIEEIVSRHPAITE